MRAGSRDGLSERGRDGITPLECTLEDYLLLSDRRDCKYRSEKQPRHRQVDLRIVMVFYARESRLSVFSIKRTVHE